MDEHPKDLGTRSLACKNWGDISQCGQQVCSVARLRDAVNGQRDTRGGVQDHGPSPPAPPRPVPAEVLERRSELSRVGVGICTDAVFGRGGLEGPKQVAQHIFNRLLPQINDRGSDLLPQEGHGSSLYFKTSS